MSRAQHVVHQKEAQGATGVLEECQRELDRMATELGFMKPDGTMVLNGNKAHFITAIAQ